jgi:hypothetical protein
VHDLTNDSIGLCALTCQGAAIDTTAAAGKRSNDTLRRVGR